MTGSDTPQARQYAEFAYALARASAEVDAVAVVEKVMVGGYLISEKPALSRDGLPIYDETGVLVYERVYAQPNGSLAMEYLSRTSPDRWGRNGVSRVQVTGLDGGSIEVEESTLAAELSARLDEVLAQRAEEEAEERAVLEATANQG